MTVSTMKEARQWPAWMALSILLLALLPVTSGSLAPSHALAPEGAAVQVDLVLDKAAAPLQVTAGDLVTYSVTINNAGLVTATVAAVTDTLDANLSFAGMLPGGDLSAPPQVVSDTLTWTGPFTISPAAALTLRYQARTAGSMAAYTACNSVAVVAEPAPPAAQACVGVEGKTYLATLPWLAQDFAFGTLAVTKSVAPQAIDAGSDAEVVFTVTIVNEGDTGGTLQTISDTLPAGLTFVGMAPGSEVTASPSGTTGTIAWSGNWPMPAGERLDVAYRVRANVPVGEHVNQVEVAASQLLLPARPAAAVLTARPPVLLEEHFDDAAVGIGRWTKFLNYWRLEEGQWRWGRTDGVGGSGAATQDCWLGGKLVAEDALLMYLEPGAEQWTDYRVETKLLLRGGVTETDDGSIVVIERGGYPLGLWVRGQYEDVGSADTAGWVTGYYVVIGGKPTSETMFVRLAQLQTLTDCWALACVNTHNLYDFNNPHTLYEVTLNRTFKRYTWYKLAVEVRGSNIKVFFEDELVMDYTDVKEPFLTGTVGFKTYKSKTASFDDVLVTPLR